MSAPKPNAEPRPDVAPLRRMSEETPTQFFNDSCASAELTYSIERGATGATSNPVIALNVLKSEGHIWLPRAQQLFVEQPTRNENELAWQLYREMCQIGAAMLLPVFAAHGQTTGRLSAQTNPTLHNQSDAMLTQATELTALAPNMQVKVPATSAGIAMVEAATFAGVSLNVTVSFSVPQVLAIAEAIERGLMRREAARLDISHMVPVATIMVGRLDDWMKVLSKRDGIALDPAVADWAGIACAKRAYHILNDRGYRTRLLIAAYRHLGHWTEFVGGNVVLTMPYEWQQKANQSGIDLTSRMDLDVDPEVVAELQAKVPDFIRAYEPMGLSVAEFNTFGPVVRTLRSFIGAWQDFVGIVRDVMLPDPDFTPKRVTP